MTIPAKTEAVTQSIYNPADRGGTTIADKVANARNPPIFGLFLPDVVQPPAGSTYVRDEYRGDPDAARHETIALVQGRYATQLFSPSRREASHEDLPENGATTGPDSCSEHPSTGSIGSQCDRRINRGSSSPQEGENETLMVDATVPLELSNDEASIDPQAATQHDEPPPSSRVSPIADPESSDAVDLESTDAFDEQIEEIRKRTEQLRMRIQQDFQAEAAGAEKARDGCAIAKEYAGLNPAPNEESPLSSKIEQRLAKAKRVHDQRLANLTAVLRSTVPDEQAEGT